MEASIKDKYFCAYGNIATLLNDKTKTAKVAWFCCEMLFLLINFINAWFIHPSKWLINYIIV